MVTVIRHRCHLFDALCSFSRASLQHKPQTVYLQHKSDASDDERGSYLGPRTAVFNLLLCRELADPPVTKVWLRNVINESFDHNTMDVLNVVRSKRYQ